ncbi:mast cell protease 8-like [Elephas maximus indicus]|uniref:mast cell protease 8-like n=1 Tax=Elephas maximus indicus TaxID=99487 RepID=UPI0021167832|nr:mast cell protease 8-like [Elephas maximus indicus]
MNTIKKKDLEGQQGYKDIFHKDNSSMQWSREPKDKSNMPASNEKRHTTSDLSNFPKMMLPLLILSALLLPSRAFILIKGGKEAAPHSRPYMASITVTEDNHSWIACGGFLVQEDYVLTAAHCYKRNMTNIFVTLGAHNIQKKENTQQVIPVLQAFPHPEFSSDLKLNDIMLLKLKRKAQLNTAVQTIALPRSQDWVRAEQKCSVAGWGLMNNGWLSDTLKEVDLEVQNKQECRRIFPHYDDTTELCVGNPLGIKDMGMGDSGGPLVCNNVAHGIVSHGYDNKPPKVFTRISSFVLWIHQIMKRSSIAK